jgi:acetyltransferase-like isoleucine patch superfamily enzyme
LREPKIHPTARIGLDVKIGDFSTIGANAVLHGDIEIGREAWIAPYTVIGAGRRELGSLRAGDFLHLGLRGIINTADAVNIGHEVGLGVDTKIFTHGGYLDESKGFPHVVGPVWIGSFVWIPNAIINPGVTIGDNVVVGAGSFVNSNIPSGCFAAGTPAVVKKEGQYPKTDDISLWFSELKRVANAVRRDAVHYGITDVHVETFVVTVGTTQFLPYQREIRGPVTYDTERVKDLFRRRGIRFRYYDNGGEYAEWD